MEGRGFSFELSLVPDPAAASAVRRFVEAMLEHPTRAPDGVYRTAVAVHELVENAGRYASQGRVRVVVSLVGRESRERIAVRVANATSPEHRARLEATLRSLWESEDRISLYESLVRRSVVDGEPVGVGLVRLAVETDAELGLETEGDVVVVWAAIPLAPAEP